MNQYANIKVIIIFFMLAATSLFLNSCGKDDQNAKSMTQIQEEEGIPVKITEVNRQPFKKYLSYFSKLTGIKEATRSAIVGGKIEKIHFRVGDFVKEDQVVISFPEDHLAAQYHQAKSAFENAEKTYERMKALLEAGETSQANFDAAETQYLVSKSNYQAAKDMIFIDAPFDGYLVDIKVNEGDNVKNDTHLFTIAQLYRMKARVWVTEKEIGFIKKGMKAEISFNGKTYTGNVTEVSLGMDPMKQAFYAEIEFPNPNMELKNGLTVEPGILVYENENAIVVPRNLVQKDEKGTFVFLEQNGTAVKRYISNGMDSGILYEVSEGLKEGDRLITQGASQLTDGAKVNVIQ
ncbi:MAG: CzcB/NccB family metal efflux transporter periplasmic adaptor subunit [Ignavibacteriaceae bacterium]